MRERSVWSRLIALMLAVAMVLTSQPVNILAKETENKAFTTIGGGTRTILNYDMDISNVTLTNKTTGEVITEGSTVDINALLELAFQFKPVGNPTIHVGDTLTGKLPSELKPSKEIKGAPVYGPDKTTVIGHCDVDLEGNIRITYDNRTYFGTDGRTEVTGTGRIECQFDKDQLKNVETYKFHFGNVDVNIELDHGVTQGALTVKKTATPDWKNGKITYEVTVENTGDKTLNNVIVEDQLSGRSDYFDYKKDSVKLESRSTTPKNSRDALKNSGDIFFEDEKGSKDKFTLFVGELKKGEKKTITYETTIDMESAFKFGDSSDATRTCNFKNTVKASDDSGLFATAEKLSTFEKTWLGKSATKDGKTITELKPGDVFDYTVWVNDDPILDLKTYLKDDFKIKDELSGPQVIEGNDITIEIYDESGNLKGTKTIQKTSDTSWEWEIPEGYRGKYSFKITYKARATGAIDPNHFINNKVGIGIKWTDWEFHGYDTSDLTISKEAVGLVENYTNLYQWRSVIPNPVLKGDIFRDFVGIEKDGQYITKDGKKVGAMWFDWDPASPLYANLHIYKRNADGSKGDELTEGPGYVFGAKNDKGEVETDSDDKYEGRMKLEIQENCWYGIIVEYRTVLNMDPDMLPAGFKAYANKSTIQRPGGEQIRADATCDYKNESDLSKYGHYDADTAPYATYTVKINEMRQKLNNGAPYTMWDELNDSMEWVDSQGDPTFIVVTVYDRDGNEVENPGVTTRISSEENRLYVEHIPDETYVLVTYKVRVIGTPGDVASLGNKAHLEAIQERTTVDDQVVDIQESNWTSEGKVTKYDLTLKKVDSDNSSIVLSNVEFELHKVEDPRYSDGKITGNDTVEKCDRTDEDGKITFEDLEPGTLYYYKEVAAPEGYTIVGDGIYYFFVPNGTDTDPVKEFIDKNGLRGNPVEIYAGSVSPDTPKLVPNRKTTGGLQIYKVDLDDGSIRLAGAVFEVYKADPAGTGFNAESARVGTMTTDESGYAKLEGLTPGTYWVKEVNAPAGYIQEETVYKVEVKAGSALTTVNGRVVTNPRPAGSMVLDHKVDENGDSLAGAVFTVYSDSTCTKKVATLGPTGEDGKATLARIPEGTYYVKETTAPKGYELSDEVYGPYEVTADETVTVTGKDGGPIRNEPTNTSFSFRIRKTLTQNGKTIVNPDVRFVFKLTYDKISGTENPNNLPGDYTDPKFEQEIPAEGIEWTVPADGQVHDSPMIYFNAEGKYEYVLEEGMRYEGSLGEGESITWDKSRYRININVKEDGDGNLVIVTDDTGWSMRKDKNGDEPVKTDADGKPLLDKNNKPVIDYDYRSFTGEDGVVKVFEYENEIYEPFSFRIPVRKKLLVNGEEVNDPNVVFKFTLKADNDKNGDYTTSDCTKADSFDKGDTLTWEVPADGEVYYSPKLYYNEDHEYKYVLDETTEVTGLNGDKITWDQSEYRLTVDVDEKNGDLYIKEYKYKQIKNGSGSEDKKDLYPESSRRISETFEFEYVNKLELDTGELSVKKIVVGKEPAGNTTYTIKVTKVDSPKLSAKQWQDIASANPGVTAQEDGLTFTITKDVTVALSDLPEGDYKVEEVVPLDAEYEVSFSGATGTGSTVADDGKSAILHVQEEKRGTPTASVTVTNTYEEKTGSLSVTKAVVNNDGDTSEYTMAVVPAEGVTVDWTKVTATAAPTNRKVTLDENHRFTIKKGETVTLSGLPEGDYTISEVTDAESQYTPFFSEVTSGEIAADGKSATLHVTAGADVATAAGVTVTNTYPSETDVQFQAEKTVEGINDAGAAGETFTFGLYKTDETYATYDEAAEQIDKKQLTYSEAVTGNIVTFEKLVYSTESTEETPGEGTYYYVVKELNIPEGYTNGQEYHIQVDVTKDSDGVLKKSVRVNGVLVEGDVVAAFAFVNTYTTQATKGLEVTKELTGRALKQGEFIFTLSESSPQDTLNLANAMAVNGSDGKVTFKDGTITVTLEDMADASETESGSGIYRKEFTYTLTEAPTSKAGVTNDKNSSRELKLEATYNRNTGELTLAWAGDAENQTFINTYTTQATTGVEVTKELTGLNLTGSAFTFRLEKLIGTNADDDRFTMWETIATTANGEGEGVATDKASFEDAIVITLDDLKKTASDGTVSYPDQTFTYRVSEVKPADAKEAMIYDETPYTFTVGAHYDFESGVLTLTNSAGGEGHTFINTWTANAEVPLNGHKTLEGRKLEAERYTFEVYNAADVTVAADGTVAVAKGAKPVLSAQNAEDGSITFGSLGYDLDDMSDGAGGYLSERTLEYKVLEKNGSDTGITYDPNVKTVKVQVTYDSETGVLEAKLAEDSEELSFTNTYTTNAQIGFEAKKEMRGRVLNEDDLAAYTFTLTADDLAYAETVKKSTASIADVSGRITGFKDGAIVITLDDMADMLAVGPGVDGIYTKEFHYTLTESGTRPGVDNAAAKHLTVTATYNKNTGILTLALPEEPDLAFINTYHAKGLGEVSGTKTLTGRELKENEFTFEVKNAEGEVVGSAKNGTDGTFTVEFGRKPGADDTVLPFTESDIDKTYEYTLSEVPGELTGVDYSEESYKLTVKVTDKGDGTLNVDVQIVDGAADFTNTYTTQDTIGLNVTKELTGRALKQGEFIFTLSESSPQDTLNLVNAMAVNSSDGKVTFKDGTITVTLEDMADASETESGSGIYRKEFTYTLTEAPTSKAGVTNDKNSSRELKLEATYNRNTGELTLAWAGDAENQTFINTYTTQATTGVEVTKELTGLNLTGSAFTFRLEKLIGTNADDDRFTMWETIATTANGEGEGVATDKASFEDAIVITLDDLKVNDNNDASSYPDQTFTYRVSEVKPADADEAMIYDDSMYTFTVTAHYDFETGVLSLENSAAPDGYTFENEWTAEASVPLTGYKTLEDRKLEAGKYTFEVYNAADVIVAADGTVTVADGTKPVLSAQNAEDGSITFGSLKYTLDSIKQEDGTYPSSTILEYKVLEVKGSEEGITYDPNVKTVKVQVTYNFETGVLEAKLAEDSEGLSFTNTYTTDAQIGFEAKKEMRGRALNEDDLAAYTFTLTADDLAYAETVKKSTASIADVSGRITGFKDGAIVITLDDMADMLAAGPGVDGIYTKEFHYTLTESGTRPGVTNDQDAKHLTVTATYNKNTGILTLALPEEPDPTFINTYHAEGLGEVSGTKTLTGRKLEDNRFTFAVKNEKGQTVGFAQNAGGSFTITGIGRETDIGGLNVLPFTEEDAGQTYTGFTLSEVRGSLAGVTYSDQVYGLTVSVTDNGDGTLKVDVTVNNGPAAFTNTYTTRNWISLDATKELVGRDLKDGEFSFTLQAADPAYAYTVRNNSLTVTNDANGRIDFGTNAVTITLEDMDIEDATEDPENSGIYTKDFRYTLTEQPTTQPGGDSSITNDLNAQRNLTLRATYNNETGTLALEWLDGADSQTFTNTYDTQAKTGVELTKKLNGLNLKDGAFTFQLEKMTGENGRFSSWETIATAANGVNGMEGETVDNSKVSFRDAIVITLDDLKETAPDGTVRYPDTFTYRVSEVKPADADEAMLYDDTVYTFTVDARYDFASGELTLTNHATAGGYTFTNTWTAEDKVPLTGTKVQEHLKLKGDDYSFAVYAEEDVNADGTIREGAEPVLGPVKNTEKGDITFGTLEYDLDDIEVEQNGEVTYPASTSFTYKVVELPEGQKNENGTITYDRTVKTVVVNVTYNMETGVLDAELADSSDSLVFTNEYDTEAKIAPNVSKTMDGREWIEDDEYTFTLEKLIGEDVSGRFTSWETIATATNDKETVNFAEDAIVITLDDMTGMKPVEGEEGLFTKNFYYRVTETAVDASGVTSDPDPKRLTLIATYNENDGALTLAWAEGSENAEFVNTYKATGTASLAVRKEVVTGDPAAAYGRSVIKEFVFDLYQAEDDTYALDPAKEAIDSAVVTVADGTGTADFKTLEYDSDKEGQKAGTYYYVVKEKAVGEDPEVNSGLAVNTQEYHIEIAVTDNKKGTLETAVKITDEAGNEVTPGDGNTVLFTNRYTAEGDAELYGIKTVVGGEFGDNTFRFRIQEVRSDGSVADPQEGDVTSNTDNPLVAEAGAGEDEFGETYSSDWFDFHYDMEDLRQEDGTYAESVTKKYQVTEEDPPAGYTKDERVFTVYVTITDNGDGTLSVEDGDVRIDGVTQNGLYFVNYYHASGNVAPTLTKTLTGRALAAGEFSFGLYELTAGEDGTLTESAEPLFTAQNAADGTVTFDSLTYEKYGERNTEEPGDTEADQTGTHYYVIRELNSGLPGVTYDGKAIYMVVAVDDEQHNGTLNVATTYYQAEEGAAVTTAEAIGNLEPVTALTFDNTFEGSVTLRKLGTAGTPENPETLAGAAFQLFYQTSTVDGDNVWMPYNNASYVTGMDGTLTVGGLAAGDYYFIETQAPAGYVIATDANGDPVQYPFTIDPGTPEGAQAAVNVAFDVTNTPNAEDTTLVVTKQLVYENELWNAVDETFYVALYSDEELTDRVSEIQPIVFRNSNTSSTTFTDLEYGRTYYIGETNDEGVVLNSMGGVIPSGESFNVDFGNDNVVTITEGDGTQVIYFRNVFTEIPLEYYREGKLTITKQLLGADGVSKPSKKTFYAGIFSDPEYTQLSTDVSQNIVELPLGGAATASNTVNVSVPENGSMTVYVTETDENGTPVAGAASFRYDVTVDGAAVTMDEENLSGTVVITNQERETETEFESEFSEGGEGESESIVPMSTNSVKTGDETPLGLYIGLMAAAAILILLLILVLFRRRNRGRE